MWIYIFCNSYSIYPFILKLGLDKFFGVRNPKISLKRHKNKPVLKYLKFQVLGTCDSTSAKKYMCNIFFCYRYQAIIEPKMAFDSICTHRDHKTKNGLLLLELTCWKNSTEIVIKSEDVVNCMKFIHFIVSTTLIVDLPRKKEVEPVEPVLKNIY